METAKLTHTPLPVPLPCEPIPARSLSSSPRQLPAHVCGKWPGKTRCALEVFPLASESTPRNACICYTFLTSSSVTWPSAAMSSACSTSFPFAPWTWLELVGGMGAHFGVKGGRILLWIWKIHLKQYDLLIVDGC